MCDVEARVAEWRSLYGALQTAEFRLGEARAGRGARPAGDLEAEVRRLQDQSNRALRAIDEALAARRRVRH